LQAPRTLAGQSSGRSQAERSEPVPSLSLVELWAQIIIPALTAIGGWIGGAWRLRSERKQKKTELDQKDTELAQARRDAVDAKEQWQEEADRKQLDRAAELCRGNEKEAAQGQAILLGMVAMGNPNPRVRELLDRMTQLELGATVAQIEAAEEAGEEPEIVEEVLVSDVIGVTDEVTYEMVRREEAAEDGDEAQNYGDASAGGRR
jgi:hypothetical protein